MNNTKEHWDKVYASKSHPAPVAAVLTQNVELIQPQGLALDIACGSGANSIFLANLGLRVHAWDISTIAISNLTEQALRLGAEIETRSVDIKRDLLLNNSYDLILNCHYLDRSLFPAIKSALKPGGKVFFQTFTAEKRAKIGPTNPNYLLERGELLQIFADFEVQLYRDESQNMDTSDPLCGRICLIARKPETM